MEKPIYQLLEEAIIGGKIKKFVIDKLDNKNDETMVVEGVFKEDLALSICFNVKVDKALQYAIAMFLDKAEINHTKLAEEAKGKVLPMYGDILKINN